MSTSPVDVKLSAVMYTDGSTVPNPGYGGWGIYGYTYDAAKPVEKFPEKQKKGIVTNFGILTRREYDENIEIPTIHRKLSEINSFGTAIPEKVNNNQMEIQAINKALTLAKEKQYENLLIITDSQSSISAINTWYDKWVENGWLNSKGEPVKLKNELIEIKSLEQDLAGKCKISYRWVKGHNGDIGNEAADKLAEKGSRMRQFGKVYEECILTEKGEKKVMSYHDFFTKNRWYFEGGVKETPQYNGWYVYPIGVSGKGKKDGDFGVHQADGFSALVLLKEEEPILSKIKEIYLEKCKHDYRYIVCGILDTILTPANFHDINEKPTDFICEDPSNKTLLLPNGKVVCLEYNPPHLSYIQMVRYQKLLEVVGAFLGYEEKVHFECTDITDVLIDKIEKKGKKESQFEYGLKPEIKSNNFVKVNVKYSLDKGKHVREVPIKMTTKVDLPDKNHLHKLFKNYGEKLKVHVVTYRSSDHAFHYFTIAQTEDAIGVWRNIDTSTVLV